MTPDFDDDFAVYPFRRALVEESVDELPPAPPRPLRPVPARSGVTPLKLAVPLALTTFLAALAGTAAISNRTEVQHAIGDGIVLTPAQAAAPARRKVAAPKPVFVPDVTGLQLKRAVTTLKRSEFKPRFRRVAGKSGVVLEQRPKAATSVRRAGVVVLLVGGATPKPKPRPAPVATPTLIVTSVVGLPRTAAVRALLDEGLGVRIFGVPSTKPAGTVVAQSPPPGARARTGSYARINVAVRTR